MSTGSGRSAAREVGQEGRPVEGPSAGERSMPAVETLCSAIAERAARVTLTEGKAAQIKLMSS